MDYSEAFISAAESICEAGRYIDSRGWIPATSGNFSVRLADGTIAITTSGTHKGHLQVEDIMLIDREAKSLDGKKPSAEAHLHTHIYTRYRQVNAILHPHSLNSVLISKLVNDELILKNYELLKAFKGIETHEAEIAVPIFANHQDMLRLATIIDHRFDLLSKSCYGYIIAGHGLYTWGDSMSAALRHLEALDYLFDCEIKLYGLKKR